MSQYNGLQTRRDSSTPYPVQADLPAIASHDIVIALMGVTGTGKTTFISNFSEKPLNIGHGLEACTAKVEIWPCRLPDGSKIFLVDTPGFDDTYKSDSEILREIAHWLMVAYESRIKLSGIVYLHRIQDPRVTGTARKNLLMFQKLCGDNGLASVVLATTMWSVMADRMDQAAKHEAQLKNEFWKAMIDNGSTIFRHDRGMESSTEIIQYLIKKKRPVTLDIQRDMVDQGLQLNETAAGKVVVSEAEKHNEANKRKLEQLRQELEEAIRNKDKEGKEEIEQLKAETEKKMQKYREELEKMKVSREELRRQMDEQYRKEKQELIKRIDDNDRRLQEESRQLQVLQEKHKKELELQRVQMENKYYKKLLNSRCAMM